MSIVLPTIFILFISRQLHSVICGPLKTNEEKKISFSEDIKLRRQNDYDEILPPANTESIAGTRSMLGNVTPNSNVPVNALNNKQLIFGNVLPNSNPSISTSGSSNEQMGQSQLLTNSNPISALQSLTGNILPNSNPTVDADNNNQVLFGNFLPNSHSMVSTSNSNQGGQSPILSGMTPISSVTNNLLNDNLNTNISKEATSNYMIGITSPVLYLGTQQALLIPISSIPLVFQNMLPDLMSTQVSQPNSNTLS